LWLYRLAKGYFGKVSFMLVVTAHRKAFNVSFRFCRTFSADRGLSNKAKPNLHEKLTCIFVVLNSGTLKAAVILIGVDKLVCYSDCKVWPVWLSFTGVVNFARLVIFKK
jgi:hypothetical protein